MKRLKLLLLAVLAAQATSVLAQQRPPNFLVLIGDDMGVETLSSYGIGTPTAVTPNLDRLANEGVQFDNFWAEPTCSPTRAAVLTGRYPFRNGVRGPLMAFWGRMGVAPPEKPATAHKEALFNPLGPVEAVDDPMPDEYTPGLLNSELLIPELLKRLPTPYATGAVGKWHLSSPYNENWLDHPNANGFDHYAGTFTGTAYSYFAWPHIENGEVRQETGYVDTANAENAIRFIREQGDNPWFAWVAFNNPHTHVHLPPIELLHSEARHLDPNAVSHDNTQPYFLAQIEAIDTLTGRITASIPEDAMDNTYVIFFGDNGTDRWSGPPAPIDPERAKMTAYEGGVRVPLIVKGPGIEAGTRIPYMAHAVDLFATILELAAGDNASVVPADRPIDSVSLVPYLHGNADDELREWNYSSVQIGTLRNSRALRNSEYKLIIDNGNEELYHIAEDPAELHALDLENLTDTERSHYLALQAQLEELN